MSGVVINLSKYLRDTQPHAAAEIFNTRLQSIQQFELQVNQPTEVPLSPGVYLVRAHLPSGEIIDAPATVGEGLQPVELVASQSPHEWLSWQHFLGDVGDQNTEPVAISPEVRASTWLRVWMFENGHWRALKADQTSLYVSNSDATCFSVRGYFPPNSLMFLQLGGELVPQRMIGLPPVAGPIQILIRTTPNNVNLNGGILARIASFDPAIEALLRYFTAGAVGAAETLGAKVTESDFGKLSPMDVAELDEAESWARAKRVNPNGAAVGFYYMLQRAAYERLHDWPNNFANWFPWLPDAQVIHALQCLIDPNHKDLALGRSRLVQGANAGIPIYTVGLRYLYENLCACDLDSRLPKSLPVVHEAYERVRELAAAVDWTEARTTFYGPDPSSPDCSRVACIPKDHDTLFFLQKP